MSRRPVTEADLTVGAIVYKGNGRVAFKVWDTMILCGYLHAHLTKATTEKAPGRYGWVHYAELTVEVAESPVVVADSPSRKTTPKETKMRKLSQPQSDALTAIHVAKDFSTGGFKIRPDGVKANTMRALLSANLVETYQDDRADLVRLTAGGRAYVTGDVVDTKPEVVPSGDPLTADKLSEAQMDALQDIALSGWTPAAQNTVESLIRGGLIAYRVGTDEPAMYDLTDAGRLAAKLIMGKITVVPNRADRRKAARHLSNLKRAEMRGRKVIKRRPSQGRTLVARRPGGLKYGDRVVLEDGEKMTVVSSGVLGSKSWGFLMMDHDQDTHEVRLPRGSKTLVVR